MKPALVDPFLGGSMHCMCVIGTVASPLSYFRRSGLNFPESEHEQQVYLSNFQLPSPPLTHAGIDVWVLRGER